MNDEFLLPDDVLRELCEQAAQIDLFLVGELHGTREVPQLLALLWDNLRPHGYAGLAIEMPQSQRKLIVDWANGTGELPIFFRYPPSDGRSSVEILALLRHVVRTGGQILCFDNDSGVGNETWHARDRTMATQLTAQWNQLCPDGKLLGVCGNLHSTIRAAPHFADLWPSFAANVQMQNPQRVLRSVSLHFHGGAVSNNAQIVPLGDPDGPPFDKIALMEDTEHGHSLLLRLPHASPAAHPTNVS